MKYQLTIAFFLVVFLVGIGYYLGRSSNVVEVRGVDRFQPNFKKYEIPEKRFIFLPYPIEKLRVDTVKVPEYITEYVIVDRTKSINIDDWKVSFTYFDPNLGSYGTDMFNLPTSTLALDATALYTPRSVFIGTELNYTYKRFSLGLGAATNFKQIYPYVSVRYALTQYKW